MKAFGATHAAPNALTTNKRDFVAYRSKTAIVGAPWHEPMPPREFTAKSVYSDTYFKKVLACIVCSKLQTQLIVMYIGSLLGY